ncbi:chemotaxis protein CheD [Paraburkholderia sp. BCC1885]|uniref:chemotaxis protein CheD n=1 Tax=Paraburkholderia sp. BCC1885 TaxID=2562669 RepID=UPI0021B4C5EA|nr:chemotaxis protein CheD [Paraburkholderia sp. BCC1885]
MTDDAREIQVHMCAIGIGKGHDVLRATLGSCVGIGLLWRERAIYGLAHCLLPDAPNRPEGIGAKYVTQAIPSLLSLMQVQRASHDALEAVLAGGANMVHYARRPAHAPIGEQNVRTAQQLLEALGVRVVHVDVGGECGRQLLIDCHEHAFAVRKFTRTL